MDHKQFSYGLKDLDEKEGIVVAYANAYNNEDEAKDISHPSSFIKTVNENYKRIRVLKDHDTRVSLGVPKNIDTGDSFGLKTTTQFNLEKEVSRDMFSDIKLMKANGLNAELSIGYDVMERDQKDKRIIKQYKLYEYSFLTSWACNELATVTDVKSLDRIIKLIEKSYNLDYSDSRLRKIESLLKEITAGPSDTGHEEQELSELKKQILLTYQKAI